MKVVESQEGRDGSHLLLQPCMGDDVSRLGFLDSGEKRREDESVEVVKALGLAASEWTEEGVGEEGGEESVFGVTESKKEGEEGVKLSGTVDGEEELLKRGEERGCEIVG